MAITLPTPKKRKAAGRSAAAKRAPGLLLTLDQVAEELGCSRKHVERLIKAGELTVTRIGSRSVRIHRRDLDAFCAWKRDDRH